jgi:hypothetical protein
MSDQYGSQPPQYGQQQYGQPQYGQPYSSAPGGGQQDPGQTLGIVALVASIASFFIVPLIGSIVGIICGRMARTKSREAGFGDNALGKWGFIIGIISLILAVVGIIFGIIIAIIGISSAGMSAGY